MKLLFTTVIIGNRQIWETVITLLYLKKQYLLVGEKNSRCDMTGKIPKNRYCYLPVI